MNFRRTVPFSVLQAASISVVAILSSSGAWAQGLPETAPVPTARPQMVATVVQDAPPVARPVIRISTEPQAIPPERLDVRVIGARFLPDDGDMFDLASPARGTGTVVSYAERLWAFTIQRMFEDAGDDGELDVAAAGS